MLFFEFLSYLKLKYTTGWNIADVIVIFKETKREYLTLFLTRKFSRTSWRGGRGALSAPPANSGPIWAIKNPKTVLESSQKMSLGLMCPKDQIYHLVQQKRYQRMNFLYISIRVIKIAPLPSPGRNRVKGI